MSELKKRTWHYIYPPSFYECYCDNGVAPGKEPNTTHKIAWSEWAGMIWCFDCQKDMKGFGGIFDGPVPFEATKMMLGSDCFDRWDMKKKEVQTCCVGKNNMYYKRDKKRTDIARRNK